MKYITLIILSLQLVYAQEDTPHISENAPKDNPVRTKTEQQMSALEKAIAPHIEMALKTYPNAKKRYLNGLNRGESFFVTTRVADPDGTFEQIFLYVESIAEGQISGQIYSNLSVVQTYKFKQRITIPESKILDWLITKPDGSEEGNFVGKFLDTYQP